MDSDDIIEAVRLIQSAENVLILLGAGLSAPSGIPTFQEHWEGHRPRDLASLSFFNSCPVTSWRFYEERRQTALHAKPNAGHIAIAQFAKRKKHVLTITQNIDELSSRADHPPSGLVCLHGSLFDVKCSAEDCDYFTTNYSPECTVPGLKGKPIDPSGHGSQTEDIEIPPCPSCGHGLLRPGVVWFGDKLPPGSLERIDAWFDEVQRIDIVMVIGTEASVQPAASYVQRATEHGARVMYFNQNPLRPEQWEEMDEIDFFFQGDAAQSVPFLMRVGRVMPFLCRQYSRDPYHSMPITIMRGTFLDEETWNELRADDSSDDESSEDDDEDEDEEDVEEYDDDDKDEEDKAGGHVPASAAEQTGTSDSDRYTISTPA